MLLGHGSILLFHAVQLLLSVLPRACSIQGLVWGCSLCALSSCFLLKKSQTLSLNLSERKPMTTHKERHWARTPPEEGYGEKSGVPCPGDTLPWNLSKHQRIKRSKSATGEVLDPAERAVIRIAGRIHLKYILRFCVAKHKKGETLLDAVLTSLQKAWLQRKMA